MARMAFMGRSIRPGATGVGRYAANLVGALGRALPSGALSVFVTRQAPRLPGVQELRAPFATPNEYLRALWEQTIVPAQAAAGRFDVYHSPNYILPLTLTRPAIVTIHDLYFLEP